MQVVFLEMHNVFCMYSTQSLKHSSIQTDQLFFQHVKIIKLKKTFGKKFFAIAPSTKDELDQKKKSKAP